MLPVRNTPWAIILVKFSDDPKADPDREIYEKLFTDAGKDTNNMPAFFSDMSHGSIDMSGSEVFGWYTLNIKRQAYVGNKYGNESPPAGEVDRWGLLEAGKSAAIAANGNVSNFSGFVVSAYGRTDLCGFTGNMAALCDQYTLQPSLMGQEMGHGYGLMHARRDGSPDDYQDPWDIMSTAAWPDWQQPDADYTSIGPGLNAQNMRFLKWLDDSRTWTTSGKFDITVKLRPLHWLELQGFIAAEVGPYLVEFRVPERWDAGTEKACVLIHRFTDGHSYLMAADDGSISLTQGSVFTRESIFEGRPRVEVIDINGETRTATVRLQYNTPAQFIDVPNSPVGTLFGGITVGGGGLIITPDGRIIRVGPRSPFFTLFNETAKLANTELGDNIASQLATRRSLLRSINEISQSMQNDFSSTSAGPRMLTKSCQRGDDQIRSS